MFGYTRKRTHSCVYYVYFSFPSTINSRNSSGSEKKQSPRSAKAYIFCEDVPRYMCVCVCKQLKSLYCIQTFIFTYSLNMCQCVCVSGNFMCNMRLRVAKFKRSGSRSKCKDTSIYLPRALAQKRIFISFAVLARSATHAKHRQMHAC